MGEERATKIKIKQADFLCSAFEISQIPPETLPEIAFAGRSNVGKSSLINALLLRKKLVKTSSTPGKTKSINFFIVNNLFYFVDLPGYGFAKVSKAMQARWKDLIETYLSTRKTLKAVVIIMDGRHLPSYQDIQLKNWLTAKSIHTIMVLTKMDKVGRSRWEQHRKECGRVLGVESKELILFSAVERFGWEEVWESILKALKNGELSE